jgi:hypothetical protein
VVTMKVRRLYRLSIHMYVLFVAELQGYAMMWLTMKVRGLSYLFTYLCSM